MTRRIFSLLPLSTLFRPRWRKCLLRCAVTNGFLQFGMVDVVCGKVPDILMHQISNDLKLDWNGLPNPYKLKGA